MTELRKYSATLDGLLRRSFDAATVEKLSNIFLSCMKQGGAEELDFTREPEVSYNPRPARVVHILINDLKVSDAEIVAAGMQACAQESVAISPLVQLALWLDRARHLHQATKPETLENLEQLVGQNHSYIALAKQHAPGFDALLEAWEERFRRMRKI